MHDLHRLTGEEVFELIQMEGKATVVYRPVGGIGDATMMLPAITGLREKIGNDLLVVSCVDYVAPVFRNHPDVDYVFEYDGVEISKGMDLKDLGVLKDFGSTIHRYYYPCPAAIYESKYNPYRLSDFGHTLPTNRNILRSRQEVFCEHVDVEFSEDNYNLNVPDEYKNIYKEFGIDGRYVIVQLRSHDEWRDYPRMKWLLAELVRLGRKDYFQVVTIDSTQTVDIKGVISLANLNLMEVFGLFYKALLVIGPDSMACHVKGAMGGHVLGLYGPTDPSVRLKYRYAHWMIPFKKCGRQYCWYTPCKYRFCLSSKAMRPKNIIRRTRNILQEAGVA